MSIIEQVLSVFTDISEWLVEAIGNTTALFYVPETGLTLVGTLAVCGLAVSIALLLISVIRRFLRFQ